MTHDEFAKGWERLRAVYNTIPKPTVESGREWFAVLGGFSPEVYNAAIDGWIATERYKPSPAELAMRCREVQRHRINVQRAEAQRSGDICQWCGGGGYVRKVLEPESYDVFFPCRCVASPNPEKGAEILNAATNDAEWVFDRKEHAFRPRRSWISEE